MESIHQVTPAPRSRKMVAERSQSRWRAAPAPDQVVGGAGGEGGVAERVGMIDLRGQALGLAHQALGARARLAAGGGGEAGLGGERAGEAVGLAGVEREQMWRVWKSAPRIGSTKAAPSPSTSSVDAGQHSAGCRRPRAASRPGRRRAGAPAPVQHQREQGAPRCLGQLHAHRLEHGAHGRQALVDAPRDMSSCSAARRRSSSWVPSPGSPSGAAAR